MSSKAEAYVPLMSEDPESPVTEADRDFSGRRHSNGSKSSNRLKDLLFLGIIFIQAIGFILLFLSYRRSTFAYDELLQTCQGGNGKPHKYLYSPANGVLEEQIKVFDDGFVTQTIYQEYSDESDKAWQDLYNRTMMKIPKNEAALLPNRTWPIKEFPGYYIAQLDVFHQLHCLNKVRQGLRRDRYDKLLANPEEEFDPLHLSHCVDSLRQHVMCHSDPAVVFWKWDARDLVVRPRLEYPHVCKNFDKVRAWAGERHIDEYIDPKVFVEDDIPPPAIIYN